MISSSLFLVTKESQIDQIIVSKKDKIIMIVFSYDDPKMRIFLKREILKMFSEIVIVLAIIDKTNKSINLITDRNTYMKEINGKYLPYTMFYYNENYVANIETADPQDIIDLLKIFTDKLKWKEKITDKQKK